MEVAAEANLLDLDLARTKDFRGTAERIVPWLVEALDEVSVKSDFWGEELRIPHRIFVAGCAVQPGPVSVRKRCVRVHRESFPMQDEAKAGACFQYRMSPKGGGMLTMNDQRARNG